nr:DGQHR domain protein [Virgibacillus halodenitrificans]
MNDAEFELPEKETYSTEYWCAYSKQNINATNDVHVFVGSCPIEQIKKNKDIMLVDDLRGEKLWGMHKLVQRNISSERVDDILKNYLKSKSKNIKFFPSITVVLIPVIDNQPQGQYQSSDEENGFNGIDGIYTSVPNKSLSSPEPNYPVKISWSLNRIAALVVDGQHRVKAIRDFYEPAGQGAGSQNSLPVAFVVFDNIASLSVIDSTRQLFIDINNTPKRVSEQKLIFIDDRNILRRLTAKTLGVLDPGDDVDDPYQEFENSQCFSEARTPVFLNKYLVGEDGSDDEDANVIYRNHSSLFPWEVTHIITLHEEIIQNILLSKDTVGGVPHLQKISRVISPNMEGFIKTAELDQLEDDKIFEKITKLKADEHPDGEVEVLRKYMQLQQDYLRQLSSIEEDSDDISEVKEERDEQKKRLDNALISHRVFEYPVNNANEVVNSKLKKASDIASGVFNELAFVKKISDFLVSGAEELSPRQIFRFVSHARQKCSGAASDSEKKYRIALERFLESADLDSDEEDSLKLSFKRIGEEKDNNILSYLVGQQAIFGWMVSLDDQNKGSLDYLHMNYASLTEKVNSLDRAGAFTRSFRVAIELGDVSYKFSPFEGLLLKTEGEGSKMLPGSANAKKAMYLLHMIFNSILNRDDADGLSLLGVRNYDAVAKSMGARAYAFYSNHMNIEKMTEILVAEGSYVKRLKNDDVNKLLAEDVSMSSKENCIKKAFGFLMLDKVVRSFKL